MELTGAQILIKSLEQEGVDTIFGYPGGVVLPIYDEIYKSNLRHILTRHEQGAVHAADAYARVTGRTGVCITTSGPGATNAVTGIANANMDSVPLVVFTGQVAMPLLGRIPFRKRILPDHLADYQAQLFGQRYERSGRLLKRFILRAPTSRPVVIDLPGIFLPIRPALIIPRRSTCGATGS